MYVRKEVEVSEWKENDVIGFVEVVKYVKLIILIGIFIVVGVFKEEIIKEMVFYVERLIILLMLNLMLFVEVKLVDLIEWIEGRVLVVIGSLFELVIYNGVMYVIG